MAPWSWSLVSFSDAQRAGERRKRAQRGGVRSIGWLERNPGFSTSEVRLPDAASEPCVPSRTVVCCMLATYGLHDLHGWYPRFTAASRSRNTSSFA
jgi:hypothetical protein